MDTMPVGHGKKFFNPGTLEMEGGWGFMQPRKVLWDAFVEAGDMVRRRATMLSEEELVK